MSSLHPYGKPYLGHAARRQVTMLGDRSHCSAIVYTARRRFTLLDDCSQLLGNSSRWSDHEFNCSALFAHARTSLRRRCTTGTRCSGTSYGGMTPYTHDRPHGLRPQGWSSPQDEALRGTTLLGAFCKTSGGYPKDTTRSVRICMIPRFL